MVEDINAVVHAGEKILAGALSEDGDVGQRVHALVVVDGEGAVDDETRWVVFGVDEEVFFVEAGDVDGGELEVELVIGVLVRCWLRELTLGPSLWTW